MPEKSKRAGALRKAGSKKGPTAGSGGKGRRALEGRGPTPKAVDRPYHPAAKRKAAAEQRAGSGRGARAKALTDYIVGRNAVLEALRAGVPASRLEVAENLDLDRRVAEAVELAADSSVQLVSVTKRELDQRTGGANHQGCALMVAPYSYATPADLLQRAADAAQPALVVALDGTQDPHNLGAVLRSAAAFGAHGVLIPARRAAQMGPAAWKASAGAAARLPVARVTNLVRALEDFKRSGLFVVGLAAADPSVGEGAAVNGPDSLELAEGPIVIVVGSEGGGLARLTRATCDLVVSVPMDGLTESLNASVAAGIVLYEVAKRRRSGHL